LEVKTLKKSGKFVVQKINLVWPKVLIKDLTENMLYSATQ